MIYYLRNLLRTLKVTDKITPFYQQSNKFMSKSLSLLLYFNG